MYGFQIAKEIARRTEGALKFGEGCSTRRCTNWRRRNSWRASGSSSQQGPRRKYYRLTGKGRREVRRLQPLVGVLTRDGADRGGAVGCLASRPILIRSVGGWPSTRPSRRTSARSCASTWRRCRGLSGHGRHTGPGGDASPGPLRFGGGPLLPTGEVHRPECIWALRLKGAAAGLLVGGLLAVLLAAAEGGGPLSAFSAPATGGPRLLPLLNGALLGVLVGALSTTRAGLFVGWLLGSLLWLIEATACWITGTVADSYLPGQSLTALNSLLLAPLLGGLFSAAVGLLTAHCSLSPPGPGRRFASPVTEGRTSGTSGTSSRLEYLTY